MTATTTLSVTDHAGARREHGQTPVEVWALLESLDPAQHEHVSLTVPSLEARVWPRRRNVDGPPIVCMRVTIGERVGWLAREHAGPAFELEGRPLPARLEVPATWASSALASLLISARWPPHFPWHDDGTWLPQGAWRADRYAFARVPPSTDGAGRESWVAALHGELEQRVSAATDPHDAFAAAIAELRRVGHDLWRWDFGSDDETWGRDYMRGAEGQGLSLAVVYAPEVATGVRLGHAARGLLEQDDEDDRDDDDDLDDDDPDRDDRD